MYRVHNISLICAFKLNIIPIQRQNLLKSVRLAGIYNVFKQMIGSADASMDRVSHIHLLCIHVFILVRNAPKSVMEMQDDLLPLYC